MAGQSKKMVMELLSFKKHKIILKWYWKFENVYEVQKEWQIEFALEPPTRLTIAHIHDKFEADGTVHDGHKQRSGKPWIATGPSSSAMVLEQFTQSSQKSTKQCACETEISRSCVQCILRHAKWIVYDTRLLHALNEDNPNTNISIR
jgi:hypothetical protein